MLPSLVLIHNFKLQEEEVNSKKRELEMLVHEEKELNLNIKNSQREMENMMKTLADIEYLLGETK